MATASTLAIATGVGIQWTIWEGQLLPYQPIPDFFGRLGAIGEGSQTLGYLGPDCPITAYYLATTLAQVQAVQLAIMGMLGTYLRVVEPDNTLWSRVLLKKAIATRRRGRYPWSGTTYTYRATAEMVMSVQG
jgi:hypothetical protein